MIEFIDDKEMLNQYEKLFLKKKIFDEARILEAFYDAVK